MDERNVPRAERFSKVGDPEKNIGVEVVWEPKIKNSEEKGKTLNQKIGKICEHGGFPNHAQISVGKGSSFGRLRKNQGDGEIFQKFC